MIKNSISKEEIVSIFDEQLKNNLVSFEYYSSGEDNGIAFDDRKLRELVTERNALKKMRSYFDRHVFEEKQSI